MGRLENLAGRVSGNPRPPHPGVSNESAMTNVTENNGLVGRIAIGSDHGGLGLKRVLIPFLESKGYTVKDVGTYDDGACDYPDYAGLVARAVASGDCDRGIMIDSFGVASAMAANKIKGIRAAVCWNRDTAISSREHNNANLLTLGGKVLDPSLAEEMVSAWLTTSFAGGRHWPRVNKIMALERGPR